MKSLILLSLLLLQPPRVMGQDQAEKIHRLMEAYYENGVFNGAVLVSKKGKVIYKNAFGIADRGWDTPVTVDSKFNIASLSKSFTAMLILQLVEEGRIRLDGSIRDYCPGYQGMLGDSITIHQLLTHTSGIRSNLDPEKEAVQERLPHSLGEMVKYAESAGLLFKPGSGFSYSNLGYSILAYIIEQVTGKPYEMALKEKITDPAGMHDTRQLENDRIEKKLVRGYEYKLLYGYENATLFDASYCVGPGGLVSTVEDLFRWDRVLCSNLLLRDDLKVKMFTPYSSAKSGYGWFVSKKKFPGSVDSVVIADHTGSINGFGAYMARIMSDSSFVVVLKNHRSDTYIDPAFAPDIGKQILSILYGDEVSRPKRSIARHIAPLIGKYGIDSAIAEYYRVFNYDPGKYSLEESELNKLGVELLFRFNMADAALKIFEVNMLQFPRSYNTYDSYAYVLMQKKDFLKAIEYYKKGLDILTKYPDDNDQDAVKKDSEQALKYIQEMEENLKK